MSTRAIFFRVDELSDKPLLPTHFHVRRHFATLLLCCYLSYGNKTYELLAGMFNLYCHIQHSPLTWANIMKEE
jgi:hypothetical protein